MNPSPGFLGTGWSFPPSFTAAGADVRMVSGSDDIRQSLELLLATHPAERPFQEVFGCDLNQFLFEEVDQRLLNTLSGQVKDVILRHESRIILNSVEVDPVEPGDGTLTLRIDYTIRGTNSRFNLVYPFYITEAAQKLP